MKELMIHVERVVRPIRALESRKDRMREELLAHLTSIFDEELARLRDRAAAIHEAQRRLGDPTMLTRELQATSPRQEALGVVCERWLRPGHGEPVLRYAFRLTGLLAAYCVLITLIMLPVYSFLHVGIAQWPARLWLAEVFLVFCLVPVIPLALLYFKMRAALCPGPGLNRSWPRAAIWALLSSLVVPVAGSLLILVSVGNLRVSLELLYLWYPFVVLIPVALAGAALYFGPTQLRHCEWVQLDLG
jgi:hypothetical protein